MALTADDIERLVGKMKVGDFHSVYGPTRFGGARVWEVWVWNDHSEEWETRFFMEEGQKPIYFDSFLSLADHLNDLFGKASKDAGAVDWTRTKEMQDLQLKRITLYVAASVFVATVAAMHYHLFTMSDWRAAIITTVLLGIVASGGALFFGKWIPINMKMSKEEIVVSTSASHEPARTKGGKRGKIGITEAD